MSSISIPSFLSYSNEFKLLTCSYCLRALEPSIISSHSKKHLEDEGVNKEDQGFILASLIRLEVLPINKSYNKILSFTSNKPLLLIPFLLILSNIFKCSSCFTIKLSKQNILRHISIDHPSLKDKENRYKIILGQCLLINRFYFPIENKDKGREEGEASLNTQLDSAATSFLDSYFQQEESIKEQATTFTLNLEVDKLTPFQLKTKYYQFLLNKDLKRLISYFRGIEEEEELLQVLSSSLEQVLYSSIKKCFYLERIHFITLNSFEKGKKTNKGFKVL